MVGLRKMLVLAAGKDAGAKETNAKTGEGATRAEHVATSYVDAADEASKLVRTLFYFYLTAMLVVALVVGATTDRGLLLNEAVKLPFYDAGVSLQGFYILAPMLFFALHLNLLVKLAQLRGRLHGYLGKVRDVAGPDTDDNERRRLAAEDEFRSKIYPFDFATLIAGPRGFALSKLVVAFIFALTVYVAPLLLLIGVQMRFLAYHDQGITALHQALVVADALALLVFAIGFRWRLPRDVFTLAAFYALLGALALGAMAASAFVFRIDPETYRLPAPLAGVCMPFTSEAPDADLQRKDLALYRRQKAYFDAQKARYDRNYKDAACDRRKAMAAPSVLEPKVEHSPSFVERAAAPFMKPLDAWRRSVADRVSPFQALDLSGQKFDEGASFSRRNLQGVSFEGATARGVDLREANLAGANFNRASLVGAQFGRVSRTSESESWIKERPKTRTGFRRGLGADLRGARFVEADATGADFSGADLSGSQFDYTTLQGARFSNARLENSSVNIFGSSDAIFDNSNLSGAEFNAENIRIVDSELLHGETELSTALVKGTDLGLSYIAWSPGSEFDRVSFIATAPAKERFRLVTPTLSEFLKRSSNINLQFLNLSYSIVKCTHLAGVDMRGAQNNAVFNSADFRGVKRGDRVKLCNWRVPTDRVFAYLDGVAKECGDEAEELKERGLITFKESLSEPRTCKAVDVIPAARFTPEQVALWESGGATVCAPKDSVIWFEDPTLKDGKPVGERRMNLPDCHEPKVIKAWYGEWRRVFALSNRWRNEGYDPDPSDVMRDLCPLDLKNPEAPACDWAKVDAAIASQDRVAAEAKRKEEAAKRPPPRRTPPRRPNRPR